MVMVRRWFERSLAGGPLLLSDRAEHTMAMPSIRRRWTAADVREMQDESRAWPRYELLNGELLVTPAPGVAHQYAVTELVVILAPYVEHVGLGRVLTSPSDIELLAESVMQPDVFVVPADTEFSDPPKWSDVKSLSLAIEILSPSSGRTDRVLKRDFYLEHRVAEYWIVDLDGRVVERWMPERVRPVILRDELHWAPAPGEPLVIDLTAFFVRATGKRVL